MSSISTTITPAGAPNRRGTARRPPGPLRRPRPRRFAPPRRLTPGLTPGLTPIAPSTDAEPTQVVRL